MFFFFFGRNGGGERERVGDVLGAFFSLGFGFGFGDGDGGGWGMERGDGERGKGEGRKIGTIRQGVSAPLGCLFAVLEKRLAQVPSRA